MPSTIYASPEIVGIKELYFLLALFADGTGRLWRITDFIFYPRLFLLLFIILRLLRHDFQTYISAGFSTFLTTNIIPIFPADSNDRQNDCYDLLQFQRKDGKPGSGRKICRSNSWKDNSCHGCKSRRHWIHNSKSICNYHQPFTRSTQSYDPNRLLNLPLISS